jgi:hypothetical protein
MFSAGLADCFAGFSEILLRVVSHDEMLCIKKIFRQHLCEIEVDERVSRVLT